MVADNQRCESPVAGKFPENSQWVEASQQLRALPNPPAPIPETSLRVFDPLLAAQIGLLETIFIFQLHYWLMNPKAGYQKGGVKWIYNGYKEWLVQLPFIESVDILGRIIRNLERMGLIETGNFNNNPYDRRKWYRIIYEELARRYGWNPLNLLILQESRMDNAAIQNGFCTDTESYTDYPQNLSTKDNNIDNAFLKNGNEKSVTSTVTVNESVEGEDECRTESRCSTPETTTTTVEEPSSNEIPPDVISRESSKLPLDTSSTQPIIAAPDDKNLKATSSRNCTENHESTVKPQKPKKVNTQKHKIDNPEEESITKELDKAGLLTPKLKSLALKFSLEAVQKTLALLNQQGNTIKNPAGWFTKCLRGKWWKQSQRKKAKPKKSWEDDFSSWYEWAIAEGIVEDTPLNYLSTDSRGEPYVRLAQPNRFSNAPYTLEHWRTAKEQFPMADGALEKLSSSLPTDEPLSTAGGDVVRNRPVENNDRLTSGEFVDTSPGGVSGKREISPDADESPAPQGGVTHSHPVESITEDNSLDNLPDSSLGGVSRNVDPEDSLAQPSSVVQNHPMESVTENSSLDNPLDSSPGDVFRNVDSDDSGTQPSSVMQSPPVEAVNENDRLGSPPDISSGDVSGELSPGESRTSPSHLTQNHSIESITPNDLSDSSPDYSLGGVSQNLDPDDFGTQPSSVPHTSPMESVTDNGSSGRSPDTLSGDVSRRAAPLPSPAPLNYVPQNDPVESISPNGLSGSPPNSSSFGDVSRKIAVDFTDPDWIEFPWEPKNGWQPGAERERSRRHKAEWCRNQLLRVSSDEEMHELFHQLGDCALECLEWVDRNLLTPHEIASRHARIDASRNCQQQSLLE